MRFLKLGVLLSKAPDTAPTNVSGCSTCMFKLKLHWIPPKGPIPGIIRGYRIIYFPYNKTKELDSPPNVTTVDASVSSMELTDLTNATCYNISVLAFTIKDGPPSASVLIATDEKVIPRKYD